ncbi:MAG TPA: 3-deoxy-7-phosphoheptulonate synthase, partial [Nitrococcus sp.]|nr:3-deoxy-7-phosphoheptulonate synthase [Nitrococcus sp.]
MTEISVDNLNVLAQELLPTPVQVKSKLPLAERARETVVQGRQVIKNILDGKDHRLLVVVGPCSIHDVRAANEYAAKLKVLHDRLADSLFLVMRVYFEKPRTTVGWKGLINDPYLDDSFHIEEGLYRARALLLYLAELGLPAGTEALDPITPQYLGDLISWTAIGARTTESQTHREMASGLSTAVGFKNGTDGSLAVAINALRSAATPHSFLGITQAGQCAVIRTRGNRDGHIVLRGGNQPNYDSVSIALCEKELEEAGLPSKLIVDCSHANSNKDPALQPLVLDNLVTQILEGNKSIIGMMLESNLGWGQQKLNADNPGALQYGISITDPCIDWPTTEHILCEAAEKL